MGVSMRSVVLTLIACIAVPVLCSEEETPADLFVFKEVTNGDDLVTGSYMNITLTVFNAGDSPAFDAKLADAVYPSDHFTTVDGGDYTTSFDKIEGHSKGTISYAVIPTFAGIATIPPATVTYSAGEEGTATVLSNVLPNVVVLSTYQRNKNFALKVGRYVSLNIIRTEFYWMVTAAVLAVVLVLFICRKMYSSIQSTLVKKRRERALEELKAE